ncbi:MAG: DUF4340 domain-containing protein [Terrimicrobiaceae bacterium]|nr:DUF4340 domain-containing protein [Terrimicrobiaceae bacterium]
MSRLGTLLLLLLAIAAGLFLWLVEPHWKSTREVVATRDYVLHFDPSAIRGIRVAAGDDGFELSRRGDGWSIGPKPKDVASPRMVGALLEAAANLRVFDVIRSDELRNGRDLNDFGLAKPRSQFDLVGDGDAALYFGKEAAGDGRIYVRKADSNDVFVVSDDLQRLAFRNAQEFRDRRLTNLTPDRIDKFAIKRGLGEIALERGGQGWQIVRPFRARADDAAVDRLLQELLGLEILDFVADESDDLSAYGLGEPRAELILDVEDEARPIALRIGADADHAGTKAVLAQFTARDSIYHLPAKAWTLLQLNPDDLRDRHLLELNLDTVDALRLRDGAKAWTVQRDGEKWNSGDRAVPARSVEGFVKNLTRVLVSQYLPFTAGNAVKTGLDKPAGEIAFDAWLSENTPEMTAGHRAVATLTIGAREGGNAYVRVNESPEICVIPAAALDALPGSPR